MPLDMNGLQTSSHLSQPMPLWRELGFLDRPTLQAAGAGLKLFRVSSVASQLNTQIHRLGQFFSLEPAQTRSGAERRLAVMEFGNQIRFLNIYTRTANTPVWVGRVDPGDFARILGNTAGSQVFLEKEYEGRLLAFRCFRLEDDVGGKLVVRGPSRTQ